MTIGRMKSRYSGNRDGNTLNACLLACLGGIAAIRLSQ